MIAHVPDPERPLLQLSVARRDRVTTLGHPSRDFHAAHLLRHNHTRDRRRPPPLRRQDAQVEAARLAHLVDPAPRPLRHRPMPGPARLETLRLDPLQLPIEGEEQRGGRRVRGLAFRGRALERLETEVEAAPRYVERAIVRPLRGHAERQPRRQRHPLLRSAKREVESPAVDLDRGCRQ